MSALPIVRPGKATTAVSALPIVIPGKATTAVTVGPSAGSVTTAAVVSPTGSATTDAVVSSTGSATTDAVVSSTGSATTAAVVSSAGSAVSPTSSSANGTRELGHELSAVPTTVAPYNTEGEKLYTALTHVHFSAQGIRPTMEDEVVCLEHIQLKPTASSNLNGIASPISIFAVLDGHGGRNAAQYTRDHLPRNVIAQLESGHSPETALIRAFEVTDEQYIAACGKDTSGTTAVLLLIEQSTKKYWCANAGDSRCILGRTQSTIHLSSDHKPYRVDERDRIIKAGGFVARNRVMGDLSVSRAIGDKDFKSDGVGKLVIATPEIVAGTIDVKTDDYAVLACDGLYDVSGNDDIMTFVRTEHKKSSNLAVTCEKLVKDAIEMRLSRDNVSVVLLKL